MKPVIVLGAGGLALNTIDLLLNEQDEYEVVGILDPEANKGILGVPVLGDDSLLERLQGKGVAYAFPAVGFGDNINNHLRVKLYEKLKNKGFTIPNLISSRAFIRSGVKMGDGNIIQAGSVIDSEVQLGNNVCIGFNVVIGHRCQIDDHVTITGTVNLNGGVHVGVGSFLGMSCVLYRNVGQWCKISPGVAIMEDIPDHNIAFGQPVRYFPDVQDAGTK